MQRFPIPVSLEIQITVWSTEFYFKRIEQNLADISVFYVGDSLCNGFKIY